MNLGRVGKGEDDFLAALRETEEEVGFTATDLEIYQKSSTDCEFNDKTWKE